MYGVLGRDGGFIHTSNTERGAKAHATRNDYSAVYYCSPTSWSVVCIAEKYDAKKWRDTVGGRRIRPKQH